MADFPLRTELFEVYRTGALSVPNTKISATEIDRAGSDMNLLAAAATLMGETIIGRMARGYAGAFVDTAERERLDRVIFDRTKLSRLAAAPALVTLTLTRPAGPALAGVVQGGLRGSSPQPTRVRTTSGITYFLKSSVTFLLADLGPHDVVAEAELAGHDYSVDAGQGWTFMDAPFDGTIVAANAAASAGSADEETDADYRSRSYSFFTSLRRATFAAVMDGLRATSGIKTAALNELIGADGMAARVGEAFVLDSIDRGNEALTALAALQLIEHRGFGIPVVVYPGEITYVPVEFTGVEFDASIASDTDGTFDKVRAAITAALGNQRGGQSLLRSTILAAARSVPGFMCEDSDLTDPLGTLVPSTPGSAIRTKPELITLVP